MHVSHVVAPEVTRTRPSGSVVAVGYQRRYAMSGTRVHCFVTGSKMFACCSPRIPFTLSHPPTKKMRPSARVVLAEQKMLLVGLVAAVTVPVAVSNTAALKPLNQPGLISTWVVLSSVRLTATDPSSNGADQAPTDALSVGLETVTVTGADVVELPALSTATAVSEWLPFVSAPV